MPVSHRDHSTSQSDQRQHDASPSPSFETAPRRLKRRPLRRRQEGSILDSTDSGGGLGDFGNFDGIQMHPPIHTSFHFTSGSIPSRTQTSVDNPSTLTTTAASTDATDTTPSPTITSGVLSASSSSQSAIASGPPPNTTTEDSDASSVPPTSAPSSSSGESTDTNQLSSSSTPSPSPNTTSSTMASPASAISTTSQSTDDTQSSHSPTTPLNIASSSVASTSQLTSPGPTHAILASHHTNKGAIAGGVIGGLSLLLLFSFGVVLFLRRRRRKRTPASAEFRKYAERNGEPLGSYMVPSESAEHVDDDPPPFTQGDFNDPLFEKLRETRQAHIGYGLAI